MRILCIDYGRKRCGVAVTDPLRLIATGLETVPTGQLFAWLEDYLAREAVSDLVLGESLARDGSPNPIMSEVVGFERKFARRWPGITLHRQDEGLSSREAKRAMLDMGMRKSQRRDRARVDRIAAAIILREFLEAQHP